MDIPQAFQAQYIQECNFAVPQKLLLILHCPSQLVITYLGSQARVRRPLLISLAPHFKSLIQSYQLCFLNTPPSQRPLQIIIPFLEYGTTSRIALPPSSPMSLPIYPSHCCQRSFSKNASDCIISEMRCSSGFPTSSE